jgi:uncharacterized RDD family membrane protein YckC
MVEAALGLPPVKSARTLVTPEGVALNLQLALAGQRISAFLLDVMFMVGALLILTVVLIMAAFAVGEQSKAGHAAINTAAALWLLGFFFIRSGYFILAEMSPRAATFGKRIVGLRVVARNGGQLTADAVIARNLMRELESFLPLSFLVQEAGESGVESAAWLLGLVWTGVFLFFPLFNRDRLRIGDLLAGTWVIHAPKRSSASICSTSPPRPGPASRTHSSPPTAFTSCRRWKAFFATAISKGWPRSRPRSAPRPAFPSTRRIKNSCATITPRCACGSSAGSCSAAERRTSMRDDDDRPTLLERLGSYLWLFGILVLIAWFALIWSMFGDVL